MCPLCPWQVGKSIGDCSEKDLLDTRRKKKIKKKIRRERLKGRLWKRFLRYLSICQEWDRYSWSHHKAERRKRQLLQVPSSTSFLGVHVLISASHHLTFSNIGGRSTQTVIRHKKVLLVHWTHHCSPQWHPSVYVLTKNDERMKTWEMTKPLRWTKHWPLLSSGILLKEKGRGMPSRSLPCQPMTDWALLLELKQWCEHLPPYHHQVTNLTVGTAPPC